MYIGTHISIRNGYYQAAQTAWKLGANAFQFFPKNPRGLSVKSFDNKDAARCASFCKQHQIMAVAHSPYPSNLTAKGKQEQELVIHSLLNDLEIVEACGAIGVVVHFGSTIGEDPLEGYKIMLHILQQIVAEWEGNSLLLIENNAGKGARMGITMEESVQIRSMLDDPDKVGFCFDTCHAFASGLWKGDNWSEVWEHGCKLEYFKHTKAVHLNDSVYEKMSYKDRHANIGEGKIGLQNIKQFLTSPFLKEIPVILETPSGKRIPQRELQQVYDLLP